MHGYYAISKPLNVSIDIKVGKKNEAYLSISVVLIKL